MPNGRVTSPTFATVSSPVSGESQLTNKKARRSTDGALMFVLLLMEICRSLFDGLHLNSDDRKRAVRSFERLLGAHRRRTQIYSAGCVISEFACQRHHQWH